MCKYSKCVKLVNDMQRYLILMMFFGAATAKVYEGQGQMHYSRESESNEYGLRMVYRPDSYETYSRVDSVWHCYFKDIIYLSDYYLNKKYYADIIATDDWTLLSWDNVGKYYYYEHSRKTLQQEYFIGYAIYIYDYDFSLIYNDTYHHYVVPYEIDYCNLDHEAGSDKTKCSEILDRGSSSGNVYSNAGSYDEGVFKDFNAATGAVYKGHGQMYCSHKSEVSQSGVRIVYRPESYKTYSPVGLAWLCYFRGTIYPSNYQLNKKYYADIIATYPKRGTLLDWDNVGKYYYYHTDYTDLQQGFSIGYAIYIYNDDHNLIYNDIYHYYPVPKKSDFCELDFKVNNYTPKCSKAFDSGSYSKEISKIAHAGTIAAVVVTSIILISMVIGVVVHIKKRRATTIRTQFQRRYHNLYTYNHHCNCCCHSY
ncbi:uncharacterized protein [Watersipora subatra]|uniref:uncharacterized protein isoform X2 n=1 Tax=Watersipora subatra TaxID=2589382 RepID=UPI00355B4E3C